ncbi:hypothetical protein [Acinetobacter lanii]|uniref:Uncharacterized protein n=1 Tax=Acinetobacter lanii TaxID=2715163 RepID=A0A6G8S4M4_9GAMM|nr:hypothetical protein [Acinetobacter lanii]QIO09176.1 hypothetical protein G8D99_09215 [Acinetobacter lanii]
MGIAETAEKVILGGAMNTPAGRVITIFTHIGTGGLSGKADQALEATVALGTAENAINIGGKISPSDKAKAQQKIKEMIAAETSKPCRSNNSECNKRKHRGKVHSQDGAEDIVSAEDAGTNWIALPNPPSLTLCNMFALSMRVHMLNLKGHSPKKGKGVDFEIGANKAYFKLTAWMKEKTPNGVPVNKYSFNFDGKFYMGAKPPLGKNTIEDRRIDLDVFEGEILKNV